MLFDPETEHRQEGDEVASGLEKRRFSDRPVYDVRKTCVRACAGTSSHSNLCMQGDDEVAIGMPLSRLAKFSR
jgi:hypothetical protein